MCAFAGVMELADVLDSKSSPGNRVRVRPPPPAPARKLSGRRLSGFLNICDLSVPGNIGKDVKKTISLYGVFASWIVIMETVNATPLKIAAGY